MGDSEKENEKKRSHDFDIDNELSALVANNVISSRIAERLGQKIKEKNININKEQLNMLVEKIRAVMRTYGAQDQLPKAPTPEGAKPALNVKPDENMQKLVETIEKLEGRLDAIESGNLTTQDAEGKKSTTKVVTTDDIKTPYESTENIGEWLLDPLAEIPNDPESVVVLMKWLQYLIDKCGRDNLSNILDYYVDIGWISQDAKISLVEYSQGITDENKKGENLTSKTITDLPSKDHIQSLIYIQKLKGRQFDKHFIERIDGELTRLTKKLDNYNFK